MFRTLLPAGRIFGVDLRIHLSFPILLVLALIYGSVCTGSAMRGVGLWCALLFAVIVRETARALAALYSRLDLRAIFLLPVGGVMAFVPRPGTTDQPSTRLVTAAGPVANALCGGLLLAGAYALTPGIHLFTQPWLSPAHVLRSTVWTQFAIAVLGLVPSSLPMRSVLSRKPAATAEPAAPNSQPTATAFSFRFNARAMIALGFILLGIALVNLWLIFLGGFFLIVSQMGTSTQQALASPQFEALRVRDVMLTDYTPLSASDTLSGALAQSAHSLADVFPVLRGDMLVGAISRSTLVERMQLGGDAYLQGFMTKSLPVTTPDEKLIDAHRRASSAGSSEFIPVVEGDALVGILTPESLARAVAVVRPTLTQRMETPR